MEKKYITHTMKGEKTFLKYSLLSNGFLMMRFFLPKKNGFSVIWEGRYHTVRNLIDTSDDRKTIVSILVHPSAWLGTHLYDCSLPIEMFMENFTKENIKLL